MATKVVVVLPIALTIVLFAFLAWRKNVHLWIVPFIFQTLNPVRHLNKRRAKRGIVYVIFGVMDHFEPVSEGSSPDEERERMAAWLTAYPKAASRHRDSTGGCPKHTWFFPVENYRKEYLDQLSKLCEGGYGEVEMHLHHRDDDSQNLRFTLRAAVENFARHGALVTLSGRDPHYAFIHGNMALDNSRTSPEWCGVNNELRILAETGCFADFSLPTAPCESQTRKINSIYYAIDDPTHPKSHNTGKDVVAGRPGTGDLLLIQGPLGFNWRSRRFGILPRIENGEISGQNPATRARIGYWVGRWIHVKGRPEWVFVKVHCHGAENRDFDALLGTGADELFSTLEGMYGSGNYRLIYVTAREMFNIVKAAEAGRTGNPAQYRDYAIPPYINTTRTRSDTERTRT